MDILDIYVIRYIDGKVDEQFRVVARRLKASSTRKEHDNTVALRSGPQP